MDVQEIVSTFKRVTLDASIFKAAIEQDTIAGPIVLELLQAIEQGKLSASISASRIVAMSFCEPRSCRLQLSS